MLGFYLGTSRSNCHNRIPFPHKKRALGSRTTRVSLVLILLRADTPSYLVSWKCFGIHYECGQFRYVLLNTIQSSFRFQLSQIYFHFIFFLPKDFYYERGRYIWKLLVNACAQQIMPVGSSADILFFFLAFAISHTIPSLHLRHHQGIRCWGPYEFRECSCDS